MSYQYGILSPSIELPSGSNFTIQSGSLIPFALPASYVIFSGSVAGVTGPYYTVNGTTNQIVQNGSDASTVINNTINVLSGSGGGRLFVKSGTYAVGTTITVTNQVNIIGEGMQTTIFKWTGSSSGTAFNFTGSAYLLDFGNFTINANSNGITCIKGDNSFYDGTIRSVYILGSPNIGVDVIAGTQRMMNCHIRTCAGSAIHVSSSTQADFNVFGTTFSGNVNDIKLDGGGNWLRFYGCWFENSTSGSILIPSSQTISLFYDGCHIHTSNTGSFLDLTNLSGTLRMNACKIAAATSVITLGANTAWAEIDNATARGSTGNTNAQAKTMVVNATAINVLGTAIDLINPDVSTNITAQLTGAFTATVKIASVVEKLA